MITRAIVEEIVSPYQVKVRIPLLDRAESSPMSTKKEDLNIATICSLPNCYVNMQVGDVVCANNSPTITDYGLYAANIVYIQTTDTSTPYAILSVAGVTSSKFYIISKAFVTTVNTGGSGAGNVSN